MKPDINKILLNMLVSYSIIKIIKDFPQEYDLIQCILPIHTVL